MNTRMAIENEDSPEGSQERIINPVRTSLIPNRCIVTYKVMLVCLEGGSGVDITYKRVSDQDQGEELNEIQGIFYRREEEARWKLGSEFLA